MVSLVEEFLLDENELKERISAGAELWGGGEAVSWSFPAQLSKL